MADFATLKAKIKAIVIANTNFVSKSVFTFEPELEKLEDDPFAIIIASGNESDFANTSENRRTYAFKIRIFVDRSRGNEEAEDVLEEIVDSLIDSFDQDYTLTSSALIALAAPSAWGYVSSTKEYRIAEINLQAKTDFDVTA